MSENLSEQMQQDTDYLQGREGKSFKRFKKYAKKALRVVFVATVSTGVKIGAEYLRHRYGF
ncbi:hypothetical protein AB0L42_42505 [Streptomyces sp. NPDC052287]|uniref:hypothetical protein n=1 Tax=Streptomyces sp. NPDC052287 TaxID=3154950 RepID=UPI00342A46F4